MINDKKQPKLEDQNVNKYEEQIVNIRRVATKRTGGSKMRFSVLAAVGNKDGTIGIAIAKAKENVSAIRKAKEKAKKHLIHIKITENGSVPHEITAKFGASIILIKPAPLGAGLIAGSSVRQVLELAGYKNVSAKIIDGKNPITNAYAVMAALKLLRK